jgi:hypothetical protein
MELPPRLSVKAHLWQQAGLATALLLALLFAPGCVVTDGFTAKDAPPKPGHPCQLATTWINKVQSAPDTVHNGAPMPGIVGRVYLFGETIDYPQVGDGGMVIDMYDDTHGPAEKPLEEWVLDPVALKKFLKKDTVGWGYTLFLPWTTYRPDVTKVRLTCRYDPIGGGSPLFAPPSPLTLDHGFTQVAATSVPQAPPAVGQPARVPTLPMPTPVK